MTSSTYLINMYVSPGKQKLGYTALQTVKQIQHHLLELPVFCFSDPSYPGILSWLYQLATLEWTCYRYDSKRFKDKFIVSIGECSCLGILHIFEARPINKRYCIANQRLGGHRKLSLWNKIFSANHHHWSYSLTSTFVFFILPDFVLFVIFEDWLLTALLTLRE